LTTLRWINHIHRMNEKLLTIPEAAQRLRIGTTTLRRYLRRRLIRRVVLPGGDNRVRETDLEQFIDQRTVGNSMEEEI